MDAWSSEDFIEGTIYGIERADLYLFSPDEMNDGSMQTGRRLKVKLDDGVFTFGFDPHGIAYGNKSKIERKVDSYYINGLMLQADEQLGYGIVCDDSGETPVYKVVDTTGKIIEGKRRVIRDRYDGYIIIIDNNFAAYVTDYAWPKWHTGNDGTGYYHYNTDYANPYREGMITTYGKEADLSNLPEGMNINF
jgi:hypothetical protein